MDHTIGPRLDSTFQAYLLACRRLRTEREADRLVVRTLLGNPRVTEAEVEIVAQDDRWIARYPVTLALASNPAAPVRIALGLFPYRFRSRARGSG